MRSAVPPAQNTTTRHRAIKPNISQENLVKLEATLKAIKEELLSRNGENSEAGAFFAPMDHNNSLVEFPNLKFFNEKLINYALRKKHRVRILPTEKDYLALGFAALKTIRYIQKNNSEITHDSDNNSEITHDSDNILEITQDSINEEYIKNIAKYFDHQASGRKMELIKNSTHLDLTHPEKVVEIDNTLGRLRFRRAALFAAVNSNHITQTIFNFDRVASGGKKPYFNSRMDLFGYSGGDGAKITELNPAELSKLAPKLGNAEIQNENSNNTPNNNIERREDNSVTNPLLVRVPNSVSNSTIG